MNAGGNLSMADGSERPFEGGGSPETALELLSLVDNEADLTQRGLASRLGIALGLANALLKRAVRKGYIKVREAPARRYGYYLTRKGFQEKSKLVGDYLRVSLNFFRRARDQYEDIFEGCRRRGWHRVYLVGAGELAEIASLAVHTAGLKPLGIVDSRLNVEQFCGLTVIRTLDHVDGTDAVIITDSVEPQSAYDRLAQIFADERILAPAVLHLSRNGNGDSGGQR